MVAASAERGWQQVAIGAGAAMFLSMALGRFSYSAMIPALVESGELDRVTAGYIGGANLGGFLVGAAFSTMGARRLGIGRVLTLSIVLAIFGLIASALPLGTLWLGGLRALIGVATGCIMVLGLAITAQTAPSEKRTEAMSYIFVGVGGGILFGGTLVPLALQMSVLAAWCAVALAGIAAGGIALLAWRRLTQELGNSEVVNAADDTHISPRNKGRWYAVIAASTLFSIGIVPHTIYWFDYLARDLQLGYAIAGWHWTGVGVFAILGPIIASRFARATGTKMATMATYFVMAFGVALPYADHATAALVVSTIIFGAQPAVSTLLGARARDLGAAHEMPAMMRAIILANGIGSAAAGVAVPKLLGLTGSYELLFLTGGTALAIGGLLCLPAVFSKDGR